MTLILLYADGPGIRLLGDSGRNLGGGPLPATLPPAPKKVHRCPKATIAGALHGDWPIFYNGNSYQPDLWFEHFLATEITQGMSVQDTASKLLLSLSKAEFHGPPDGGLIIAGFVDKNPLVVEIEGMRRNPKDQIIDFKPTTIDETKFKADPIVRGLSFRSWSEVQRFCGCGPLAPGGYQSAYLQAVRLLNQMRQPVAEPVWEEYIEPTPFQRPDLKAPPQGSFAQPTPGSS